MDDPTKREFLRIFAGLDDNDPRAHDAFFLELRYKD
jgi:hypothetical protein